MHANIPSQVAKLLFWCPLGALRTPYDAPLRGPRTKMIYALTEINFDIQQALRVPYDSLKGSGLPLNTKCVSTVCPMNYDLTGINFDVQHAYIPSQLAKLHFWGPSGALKDP